jgi:hypothetical protein
MSKFCFIYVLFYNAPSFSRVHPKCILVAHACCCLKIGNRSLFCSVILNITKTNCLPEFVGYAVHNLQFTTRKKPINEQKFKKPNYNCVLALSSNSKLSEGDM